MQTSLVFRACLIKMIAPETTTVQNGTSVSGVPYA